MIQGDTGRSRAIQGDPGRYREIQGDTGRYREIQGDTDDTGDTGRYRAIQDHKLINVYYYVLYLYFVYDFLFTNMRIKIITIIDDIALGDCA